MARGNWQLSTGCFPPQAPVIQAPFQPSAWSCEQLRCLEEVFAGSVGAFPHLKAGSRSKYSPDEQLGYTRLAILPQKLMRLKQTSKANQASSKNALLLFLKVRGYNPKAPY